MAVALRLFAWPGKLQDAKTFLCSHGHFETKLGAWPYGSVAIEKFNQFLLESLLRAHDTIMHVSAGDQSTACSSAYQKFLD